MGKYTLDEYVCDASILTTPHRNITPKNILMNPKGLFPDGVHPLTVFGSQKVEHLGKRTMCPTRYYFVDFGQAQSSPHPGLFDADVVALGRVFEEDLLQVTRLHLSPLESYITHSFVH